MELWLVENMKLFMDRSFILFFISSTSAQISEQIQAYARYVVISFEYINQSRSINFIKFQVSNSDTMNNMKLTLVLVLLLVVISTMSVDAHNHFQWGSCHCQRGGERGGHCHCPDWAKMSNVYCRYGGNHWICFPF